MSARILVTEDASATLDLRLLAAVEDASLNASAPPQQLWLDGWMLRLSPGKARRARCIHALGPGQLGLAERLQSARDIFARAGLPLCFRITPFSVPSGLDEALNDLGLEAIDPTLVMVSEYLPTAKALIPEGVRWQDLDAEAFAHAAGALRGSSTQAVAAHAERLARCPVPWHGGAWLAESDAEVLAVGQVACEGSLAGLYDVITAASARKRGLGSALCERLLSRAAAAGSKVGYLQVDGQNHVAQRLYARLGFVPAYSYHYRVEPGSSAA